MTRVGDRPKNDPLAPEQTARPEVVHVALAPGVCICLARTKMTLAQLKLRTVHPATGEEVEAILVCPSHPGPGLVVSGIRDSAPP